MAFRTNAAGEYARRTANLPDDVSFTACGWSRLVADRNAFSSIFSLESSTNGTSAQYVILETDSNGTDILLVQETSFPLVAITAVNVDEWFFWYVLSSGIGTNSTSAGIWRTSTGGWSTRTDPLARAAFAPAGMYFGSDSFDEWSDARHAAIKVWDATLTTAEIQGERFTYVPRRKTNLNLWVPGFSHASLQDYGPNGRTLTAGGTLSTEEGPPIIWDYARRRTAVPFTSGAAPTSTAQLFLLVA